MAHQSPSFEIIQDEEDMVIRMGLRFGFIDFIKNNPFSRDGLPSQIWVLYGVGTFMAWNIVISLIMSSTTLYRDLGFTMILMRIFLCVILTGISLFSIVSFGLWRRYLNWKIRFRKTFHPPGVSDIEVCFNEAMIRNPRELARGKIECLPDPEYEDESAIWYAAVLVLKPPYGDPTLDLHIMTLPTKSLEVCQLEGDELEALLRRKLALP